MPRFKNYNAGMSQVNTFLCKLQPGICNLQWRYFYLLHFLCKLLGLGFKIKMKNMFSKDSDAFEITNAGLKYVY